MILTSIVFARTEYIISCYFSICAIRFVACVLYSHVVQEIMFVWYQFQTTWCQMNVMYWAKQRYVYKGQKCDESALCGQQNDAKKEIKYAEEFKSRYAMSVNCNIHNPDYHVRRQSFLQSSDSSSLCYKLEINDSLRIENYELPLFTATILQIEWLTATMIMI